jgi:hypothetical protein
VNGSLICQNERIALQFNVAIQSRAIGKLLVLPRFLQSPRERHKIKRLGNVLDLSESSDLKRTYNLVLSPQLCAAGKFSAQTKPNIVIDLAT